MRGRRRRPPAWSPRPGPGRPASMEEKYLPELMAEKDSLDPSFTHALRLVNQGEGARRPAGRPTDRPLTVAHGRWGPGSGGLGGGVGSWRLGGVGPGGEAQVLGGAEPWQRAGRRPRGDRRGPRSQSGGGR